MFHPKKVKLFPLYAAVLATLSYIIIFGFCGILGFDNSTILSGDLYQQYIAFIRLFLDALTGKGDFGYSFSLYLGAPAASTFAYYCLSPLNLLYLIPGISDSAMTIVVIVIKHALAAAAFQFFIQKGLKQISPLTILFSVCYALSSFSAAMQMHIMWLDALYILPVLICFLLQYTRDASVLPLLFTYIYLFLTNFYMGYIVGTFSFLCFCVFLFLRLDNISGSKHSFLLRKTGLYLLSVLCAAACSAFVLLPAGVQLLGHRSGDAVGFRMVAITLPDVLNNLFLGEMQSMGSPIPLIYCGLPVLLLLPFYFTSAHIDKKEKIAVSLIFVFYLCATQFDPVYRFVHAFEAPNWFAHRYAFCISFLLLAISVRVLPEISEIPLKKAILYVAALMLFYAFMVPIQKLELAGYTTNSHGWLLLNALFSGIYLLLLFAFHRNMARRHLPLLFTICVCIELVINGCAMVNRNNFGYQPEENIIRQDKQEAAIISGIRSADPDLYRIRVIGEDLLNAPAYHHYAGINSFSSMDNENLRNCLSSLGIAAPFANIYDQGYTELTDMLLGLRYAAVLSDENPGVFRQPYTLPIGYMTSAGILSCRLEADPFTNQEQLLRAMTGKDYHFFSAVTGDILQQENINMDTYLIDNRIYWQHISDVAYNGCITYTAPVESGKRMYFYVSTGGVSTLDQTAPVLTGTPSPFRLASYIPVQAITEAVYPEEGTASLSMEFSVGGNYDYSASYVLPVYYDNAAISDVYATLKAHPLHLTAWKDGYLEGDITATEEQPVLFTSIPYDANWQILLDGQSIPSVAVVNDAFLAVYLPAGTHHIIFSYEDPMAGTGKMISGISVILLLLAILYRFKKTKKTESAHEA